MYGLPCERAPRFRHLTMRSGQTRAAVPLPGSDSVAKEVLRQGREFRAGQLFLRLGRCLFWLVRWLRWALFSKDNLSFPGNVRFGDILTKLLQIEFYIGDSLLQGFVFVWHIFVPIWTGLLIGKWMVSWEQRTNYGTRSITAPLLPRPRIQHR